MMGLRRLGGGIFFVLALTILLASSLVSAAPSLQKRALKFGKCDPKITVDEKGFKAVDKSLANAVPARGDGIAFLKSLCDEIKKNKDCGDVQDSDVQKCQAQIGKLKGLLGAKFADKWNKLCDDDGKKGGTTTQKKKDGEKKQGGKKGQR